MTHKLFDDDTEQEGLRVCKKCKQAKPLSEYYTDRSSMTNGVCKERYRGECKTCGNKIQKDFGKAKKLAGNPKRPPLGTPCDCCGKTSERLLFDHDHKTLGHRGWLCDSCNTGIGKLGDDLTGIRNALQYLEEYNNKEQKNDEQLFE